MVRVPTTCMLARGRSRSQNVNLEMGAVHGHLVARSHAARRGWQSRLRRPVGEYVHRGVQVQNVLAAERQKHDTVVGELKSVFREVVAS